MCAKPVKANKATCFFCYLNATKGVAAAAEILARKKAVRRSRSYARARREANRTWWEGDKLMQKCDYYGSCEMPCNGDC